MRTRGEPRGGDAGATSGRAGRGSSIDSCPVPARTCRHQDDRLDSTGALQLLKEELGCFEAPA